MSLKILFVIKTNKLATQHNGIDYLFIPHISRTVTQNIATISNLFITIGKLKNNDAMRTLGEQIKLNKEQLYKYG
jgi:hypothetical protein